MKKMVEHEFRCLNCGNVGIPLWRDAGHLHKSFHRKKLYCYHCKCTLNFVEIKNSDERDEFMWHFNNGDYIEEARISMEVASR